MTAAYPIDVATIDAEHFRGFVDTESAEDAGGHHSAIVQRNLRADVSGAANRALFPVT